MKANTPAYVTHFEAGINSKYGYAVAKCGQGGKGGHGEAQKIMEATTDWTKVTCSKCIASRTTAAKKGETVITLSFNQVVQAKVMAERAEDSREGNSWYDSGVLARELGRVLKTMIKDGAVATEQVQMALKPAKLKLLKRHLEEWPTR